MFSWFGKKKSPATNPSPAPVPISPAPARPQAENKAPPELVTGSVGFANAQRSWTEKFDVVDSLAKALDQQGRFATREGNRLILDTSGYVLAPVMISFKPLDDGGSQTCTVLRISHPGFIPKSIFEYQHSTGKSLNESLLKGFDQWVQTDLVPLLDALEEKAGKCMVMELGLPEKDGRPEHHRRMILGPVAHLRLKKPAADEEHPFCPCCLLANTMEAFMPAIEGTDVLGIRLFAMRNADGSVAADCRINGQEFEPGKVALRKYVQKWPEMGMEFRKQYVVVQSWKKREDLDT